MTAHPRVADPSGTARDLTISTGSKELSASKRQRLRHDAFPVNVAQPRVSLKIHLFGHSEFPNEPMSAAPTLIPEKLHSVRARRQDLPPRRYLHE